MQRNLSKDCRICQNSIRDLFKKRHFQNWKTFCLCQTTVDFFDVVFLLATIEDTISFVAAKELWHYPILSRYLDSIGCVALERGAKKLETIKSNIVSMHQALAKGNLVLFPEGECSYYDEQMHKFRKGGFYRAGCKAANRSGLYKTGTTLKHWKMDCPKGESGCFLSARSFHRPRLKKEPRQPPKLQIWQETKFLHSDKCQKVDILLQKKLIIVLLKTHLGG